MGHADVSTTMNIYAEVNPAGMIGINGNFTPLTYFAQIVYGIRSAPYLVVESMRHPGRESKVGTYKFTDGNHIWDWEGCEGNSDRVFVFSNAHHVELYLNDILIETKERQERAFVEFQVTYQPGILLAKAFDSSGVCIGEDVLKTPQISNRIVLLPEMEEREKGSLIYVPIRLEDENGLLHNCSDKKVYVKVSGAQLVALGTENAYSEEDFHQDNTRLYEGQAMAILRIESEDTKIRIQASCEGCEDIEVIL